MVAELSLELDREAERVVVEILINSPMKTTKISKLTQIPEFELCNLLAGLERREILYSIGDRRRLRWFVSTKFLVRREIAKALSGDWPPSEDFKKFINGYAAAKNLGVDDGQAWELAKKTLGGVVRC